MRGEPLADQRIVAGDQPGPRLACEVVEQVVGPVHAGQVGEDGEGAHLFRLFVEVQRVGREHHGASCCYHRDDELAGGVAADLDQLDAGPLRALPAEEGEPAFGVGFLEVGDLAGFGVRGEVRAAGERRDPEVVFGPRHDDLRRRELVQVPDVIPVRVRHHDGLDGARVDAERRQGLGGRAVPGAPPPVACGGGEAGVDEGHGAAGLADDPEVVVDGERGVGFAVQVIVEEALGAGGHAVPVAHREHLARGVVAHSRSKAAS